MWSACTRWYLPLVLLPLPIAPPYFLVLFLLSTTLHARPCFYCIMLLTAMFMASCYWPPVTLDTPLSRPWADNITTFGEALLSRVPDLTPDMMPSTIPVLDRCWCDFSTGFFEPFNSTRWEWDSIERVRVPLRLQIVQQKLAELEGTHVVVEDVAERSNASAGFSVLSGINAIQQRLGFAPANTTALEVRSEPPPIAKLFTAAAANDSTARTFSSIWREYDLRPYGLDMIVDLSWPLSP